VSVTRAKDRIGRYAFSAYVVFLVGCYRGSDHSDSVGVVV
jgi:hypothetical protein